MLIKGNGRVCCRGVTVDENFTNLMSPISVSKLTIMRRKKDEAVEEEAEKEEEIKFTKPFQNSKTLHIC